MDGNGYVDTRHDTTHSSGDCSAMLLPLVTSFGGGWSSSQLRDKGISRGPCYHQHSPYARELLRGTEGGWMCDRNKGLYSLNKSS